MSNEPDAPFAQMSIKEMLDALPMLKGCVAHVFMTIGAFSGDPISPSSRDICDYTHVSKPSVSTALRFLCKHGFAHCFVDGDGIQRYRADEKYFRNLASVPVSVRVLVPVSGREREVKKYFPSPVVVGTNTSPSVENFEQQQTAQIFASIGIGSPARERLSESVCEENALKWVAWIKGKPKGFRNPIGFLISQLLADPKAPPPQAPKQNTWFTDEERALMRR